MTTEPEPQSTEPPRHLAGEYINPEIPEGGYIIRTIHQVECYCGFCCSNHQTENSANLCYLTHCVFCEWHNHEQAVETLNQMLNATVAPAL